MGRVTQLQSSSAPGWQRAGAAHVWKPYAQMKTSPRGVPIARTEDVYLVCEDGTRLLDGMASWWTACHGYGHPHMLQAVQTQLEKLPHVMFGGLDHEPASRLAFRLAQLLPGDLDHVFFCDSGSVAVEVAMKMAMQWCWQQGFTGRTKFVSFEHAYHGDTLGTMSVGDPVGSMHSRFQGALLEQFHLPVPQSPEQLAQLNAFLQTHRESIAGVLIEPLIQGAGGMRFHPPETLRGLARVCEERGVLWIADEIAPGFGRTGTMFACEQAEVVPDIMCLGKALTGGMMSLAATVCRCRVFDAFLPEVAEEALMHGPTFMANPLACTAAVASLDVFEQEATLAQVPRLEEILCDRLGACRAIPGVLDVRCQGAVGVVQVDDLHHLEELRAALVQEGVWLRPFRDIIYLTPPLSIRAAQLETLCDKTVTVLRRWATWK